MMTGFAQMLLGIMAIIGFVYAFIEYQKKTKDSVRDWLARDAYAFYFIEQEAVKEIKRLETQLGINRADKTIRNELREKAMNNTKNEFKDRPQNNASKYRKHIKK